MTVDGRLIWLPLLVVLVGGVAYLNDRQINYSTLPVHICTAWSTTQEAPAADVLFIGSSRTGAAVDPVFIAEGISVLEEREMTVEKLIAWNASHVRLNLLLRRYLKNRGAPRTVYLELMYRNENVVIDTTDDDLSNLGLHVDTGAIQMGTVSTYSDLFDDIEASHDRAGNHWFPERNVLTKSHYVSAKIVTAFYHFWRNPLGILIPPEVRCAPERRRIGEGAAFGLVFGSLDVSLAKEEVPPAPEALDSMVGDSSVSRYEAAAGHEIPFQDKMHRIMIQLLREAGTKEIMIVRYPAFRKKTLSPEAVEKYRLKFGDTKVMDLGSLLSDKQNKRLSEAYRDPVHVTLIGAEVISSWFVQNYEYDY